MYSKYKTNFSDSRKPVKTMKRSNQRGGVGNEVIVISIVVSAIILIIFGFLEKSLSNYHECQNNMKSIAIAPELYSTDHAGHYPDKMKSITSGYIKKSLYVLRRERIHIAGDINMVGVPIHTPSTARDSITGM